MQALAETQVHASDAPYRLNLTLPPKPFIGLHDAPLVILLANPGFHLVRRAMSRDAVIVLGRIAATWKIAVPELASYPSVVTPNQNRSVPISRGNFSPEDFERIEHALKS